MSLEDKQKLLEDKLIEKIHEELKINSSYEAMLYIQTFIGRKKRLLTNLNCCKLILCSIKLFIELEEYYYAGVLYDWMLYLNTLDINTFNEIFQLTLNLISNISKNKSNEFIQNIFQPLSNYIDNNNNFNNFEKTKYLYQLNQKCGELFEITKKWRDAKNSYLSIGDITSVARVVHLWSEEGYQYEYPLFFARTYLSFLVNRLIPQATAFFRAATDDYLDSYEFTLQHEQEQQLQQSQQSLQVQQVQIHNKYYSIWQMCIIINDLLGLMDTPSIATKINPAKIYQLVLSKFEKILKFYDENLYQMAVIIGHKVFHIPEDQSNSLNNAPNPMQMISKLFGGNSF